MTRKRTRIRNEKASAHKPLGENRGDDPGQVRSDGFTLSFSNGRGILALNDIPYNDLLTVQRLELVIPNLAFPFDVTGGVSGLKHRRHTLGSLKMTIPLAGLEERIHRNLGNQHFCTLPTIVFEDTHIAVLFEYGPEGSRVRVGFRLLPWPSDNGFKLLIDEPRVYGPLPAPSLAVITSAIQDLTGNQSDGLTLSIKDPLKSALLDILPARGWRLPNYTDITLSSIDMLPDKAVLEYRNLDLLDASAPTVAAKHETDALNILRKIEESRLIKDGDLRLCAGDIEDARSIYTTILNRDPSSLIALARLTMVDIINPDLRDMIRLQAADALSTHSERSDLAAALAQGAALAGDTEAEIDAFRTLATGGDSLERFAAGCRLGELLFESDPPAAAKSYLAALNARREDLPTLSALLRTYAAIGDKERVYALIPRRIAADKRSENRAAAYLEVGSLLLHQMDDPASAVRYFERAQVSDPKNLQASWGLAESSHKSGDVKRAITQYEHLSRISMEMNDSAGAAKALSAIGAIWAQQGDAEIAIHRFHEALNLSPEMHRQRTELAQLLRAQSRPAEAANEYEIALSKSKQDKESRWWQKNALDLGELYLNELDDPAAAEAWFRQCESNEMYAEKATDALCISLERQGNYEMLAEQLERDLRENPTPETAVRLGEIRIADGNLSHAISHIEKSLAKFPEWKPLQDLLIDACRRSGDYQCLKGALENKLSHAKEGDERALLELELGQLELEIFKTPISAVMWLKRAEKNPVAQAEANQYLAMAVERMHGDADQAIRDGDWDAARTLFSVIEGELTGIEKYPVYLKEAQSAIQFQDWKTALNAAMAASEGPSSIKAPATNIAADCLIALEAPDEAVRHLEHAAESLDPTHGAAALYRASEISENQLGDSPGTIRLLRRVLEIDPEHEEASATLTSVLEATGDNAGLAERLISLSNRNYSPHKIRHAVNLLIKEDMLDRALTVLENLYDKSGQLEDALQLVRVLRENFQVDRLLNVFAKLRSQSDPVEGALLEEMEILADVLESQEEFEDAYKVNTELMMYPDPNGTRAAQAARIAGKVGNIEQARTLFFDAISKKPEPSRIMRLLSILDPAEDAVDLERLVSIAGQFVDSLRYEDRVTFLNAQANLYFSTDREDEGMELLSDIVELNPRDRTANDKLVSIFSRKGQWERVAELLKKRMTLLEDPQEIAETAGQLGEILDTKLGDERGAQSAYDKAIAMDPSHQTALRARAAMAYQRQEWPLLNRLTSRIEGHHSDTTLLLWNASSAEHIGQEREAIHLYQKLLSANPNHQPAADGLTRLEQKTDLDGRLSAAFDELQEDE